MNTKSPVVAAGMAVLLSALSACEGYTYTVNERTVFEKPKLFSEFDIADEGLRACVEQAISDGNIKSAETLEDLKLARTGGVGQGRTRHAGKHDALHHIDLCQGTAKQIALAGNDALDCADIAAIHACGTTIIDQPAHCAGP